MPKPPSTYQEIKLDARNRLIAFLGDIARTGSEGSVTRLSSVRGLLHHAGYRFLTEPLLCDLEAEGWIETEGQKITLCRSREEFMKFAGLD